MEFTPNALEDMSEAELHAALDISIAQIITLTAEQSKQIYELKKELEALNQHYVPMALIGF